MKLECYQVDAFTNTLFAGNPACVVPLKKWLPDALLLQIAKENAVAETAFFIEEREKIHLRWFTPEIEMDLCGHATLATAHVLINILQYPQKQLIFRTHSGDLQVHCSAGLYYLNFPSRKPVPAELPTAIRKSLNILPRQVLQARDYVLVYEKEEDVRNIEIDPVIFNQINLDPGGVVVTAPGENCDFVSRFFTPQCSIMEDPVTGSAHCSLIPYWEEQLGKKEMIARQISERGGKLYCTDLGSRVLIGGQARTYSIGNLWTE